MSISSTGADRRGDAAAGGPSEPSPQRARGPWRERLERAWALRSASYRDRRLAWRVLTPTVFVLAGGLFVTSAVSSDGTELRPGRYGDLASVVRQQTKEVDALNRERDNLAAQVDALAAPLGGGARDGAQERVEDLQVPAGLRAMSGPGLTIELDDASNDTIASAGVDPNYLIVHQQDLQAVVNALWAGGAEAMAIQGQRVIATTGIKCVGNTVVLRGVPYSPPYVITAVGDPLSMLQSVNENPYIQRYLDYVERFDLGWDVLPHTQVEVPAYRGSLDLEYARPTGRHADL
jgi:uncharacterized protein YlxW (UPF0749 family)